MKRTALQRRTPLKSTIALKGTTALACYAPLRSTTPLKASTPLKQGKPLASGKPMQRTGKLATKSDRQKQRDALYNKKRLVHLQEHPLCEACLLRGLPPMPATEVHHKAGREKRRDNDLTTDSTLFCAICRDCHNWELAHPQEAKALGISLSRHLFKENQ